VSRQMLPIFPSLYKMTKVLGHDAWKPEYSIARQRFARHVSAIKSVTWRLEAGIVHCSLKHVSMTTNMHPIIDELFAVVISIRFVPSIKGGHVVHSSVNGTESNSGLATSFPDWIAWFKRLIYWRCDSKIRSQVPRD
jgi:hypothetical protein